ncbi:hypothetical protein HWV62_21586 [Athelia sp. TMB]|nr:hypothetical protein HWV62_21568 [Athelia sp. TMB]KAF7971256.1 hypothetical protein HWV62_21586 [Athelia sp. TMB]
MEQLDSVEGHIPRLAQAIRGSSFFKSNIRHVTIDEAHCTQTDGQPKHGRKAFRPSYGKFHSFRLNLPQSCTVLALSATLPPYILDALPRSLRLSPGYKIIQISVNRPNISYASHPIIKNITTYANINFMIPADFHPPMVIPSTLCFIDGKKEVAAASRHVDALLPPQLRDQGIVLHYHSDMTPDYLEQAYEAFSDGRCRVLIATRGAAMVRNLDSSISHLIILRKGVDFPGVKLVVQFGIPQDKCEELQRVGRAGRSTTDNALYILLYEPWVLDVTLPESSEADPDRPVICSTKKYPTKQERTGVAMVKSVQCKLCTRKYNAGHTNDTAPDALDFTGLFCCDKPGCGGHDPSGFGSIVSQFLCRPLLTVLPIPVKATPKRKPPTKRRLKSDQLPIKNLIGAWRSETHAQDPCRSVRSVSWLIDDAQIKSLITVHPASIRSPIDIKNTLEETDEWYRTNAFAIFDIIQDYDTKHPIPLPKPRKRQRQQKENVPPSPLPPDPPPRLFIRIPARQPRPQPRPITQSSVIAPLQSINL